MFHFFLFRLHIYDVYESVLIYIHLKSLENNDWFID